MKKLFRLAICGAHESCTASRIPYWFNEKAVFCFLLIMLSAVLLTGFFKDYKAALECKMGMATYKKTNVVTNQRRVRGPNLYSKLSLHAAKAKSQNVGNALRVESPGFGGLADVSDRYGFWSMDASCRSLNNKCQQLFKPSIRLVLVHVP
jgi:hypothetical protein